MNGRSRMVLHIAELIEPHEFRRWQQIYAHEIRGGAPEETARRVANHWHGASIERACETAEQVLAALGEASPLMERAGLIALEAGGTSREIWRAMIKAAHRDT